MKTVVKTFQQKVVGLLILLLVATSVQAQNLTVRLNGTTTVTAQSSLQNAITSSGVAIGNIKSIEVNTGSFTANDWYYIRNNRNSLGSLTHFVITNNVTSVANIPNTSWSIPYFKPDKIEAVFVAKVTTIGNYAFRNCSTLTIASFPSATSLGYQSFRGCTSLNQLALGGTPPTVNSGAYDFGQTPNSRYLILVDTDGNPLTGSALTTAQTAYTAVNDGNSADNLWYGWEVNATLHQIAYTSTANGQVYASLLAKENETVNLTITPDEGYKLQDGSLKVYKTGDITTEVTVSGKSFTMPAYDVTVEAVFEQKPPFIISIDGAPNKTGTSLQNVLAGETLSAIKNIKITGGAFTSDDWEYLKSNRNQLVFTDFTITDGVTSVADIDDTTFGQTYFPNLATNISIAKLQRIGNYAFSNTNNLTTISFPDVINVDYGAFNQSSNLTSVSLPKVTNIEQYAFYYCNKIKQLTLGATPPTIASSGVFNSGNSSRYLILTNANGELLEGTNLTTARANYTAVNDGNTSDNKWYTWATDTDVFEITNNAGSNGTISINKTGIENETINFSVSANQGYLLKEGTLKAYKTGDVSTIVSITNNSFTMPAYNVTIEAVFEQKPPFVVTINGSTQKTDTSLEGALTGETLTSITSLKITSGAFTTDDWEYLKTNANSLNILTNFTITNGITFVDDMPSIGSNQSYFRRGVLTNISIAKLKNIGDYAFYYQTKLVNASFPDVETIGINSFNRCTILPNIYLPKITNIGPSAFAYCYALNQLTLGETPPTLGSTNAFYQVTNNRHLVITDANGNLLSGQDLTNARTAYDAVNDGNTTDNRWYGWKTDVDTYQITPASTTNGSVSTNTTASIANETININVTPDAGYILTAGTLKVYETGNINNTLTVTNNSFTMPAFNVTVEASFEAIPPLNVEINGVNKTGTSLKTLLSSETLNTITSIKVTSGIIVTEDWEYLRTNKNSFTAMTDFIVTDGISFVDDIPDTPSNQTYFNGNYIKNIEIAKVASIGNYAFYANYSLSTVSFPDATTIKVSSFQYSNNLTSAFLPKVTSIGNSAFRNCSQLNQLSLGATPPTVTSANDFYQTPNTRYLFLKNQDGSPLTGADLTNARNAYKAISDGNTSDNKWYGWIADADVYQVALSSVTNGSLTADKTVEEVGNTITLTVTPNAGYYLKENSLKVYKTGDPTTTVSISTTNTFTMPAYNVTVEAMFELIPPLEVTINGVTNKTGSSLQDALTGETLSTITSLEITNGVFSTTDWNYLKNNRFNLNSLTHFTITDGILSVDDIPNTYSSQSYLNKDVIENVSIAKVKTIGQYAFYNNTKLISASFPDATTIKYYALGYTGLLKNVSIPQVTNIEGYAFRNASSLEGITLGATPPTVTSNSFTGTPTPRFLVIADANGTNLSGVSLTNAQTAYQAVSDGNTSDNLWYGWTTDAYYITYTTTTNGSVSGQIGASENETIDITITPDAGYLLKSGSLKAYKTGDTNTTITITNNSFTMPAFDVTVEAIFEVKPPLLVTVNGSNNKSGSSLENALNGETLSTITSLEITSGAFTTEDWNYLKANKSSFTAMTDFTITNGITSVDDIPDTGAYSGTYLNVNVVERINVAKLKNIGLNAFRNSNALESVVFPDVLTIGQNAFYAGSALSSVSFANATHIGKDAFYAGSMTSVSFPKLQNIGANAFQAASFTTASFPEVTSIENSAFQGSAIVSASFPKVTSIGKLAFYLAANFTELRIGATPPSVELQYGNNPFVQTPDARYLTIVDANDTPLTSTALTNARTAYQAVNDGSTSDNKWYGWTTNADYTITYTATTNGTVTGSIRVAENETINLTITPDVNYHLKAGTLKAFKTGNPTTTVTITNNSFTMPAYDVTVEAVFEQLPLDMVVTFNNATTINAQASLEGAVATSGLNLDAITSIEVSAGTFRNADWEYLKANKYNFSAITDFTITNGISSVADITDQYFSPVIENISIAKVKNISGSPFSWLTKLKNISLSHVEDIATASISNCPLLTNFNIGATPPTIASYSFFSLPSTRFLTFVDANGTPLTGTDLTDAQTAYKNVNDGNTSDNLWYGWIASGAYNVIYSATANGSISGKTKATENEQVPVTVTPNAGYILKEGSLKVYKTGDTNTTISVTANNTFTMPAYDVTVEAMFETAPPLQVTINGTTTKTGTSLENALTGETLADIISLEITAGLFSTDDWNYLKTNRNSFTSMTHFTITNSIGGVADMPDTGWNVPYFNQYKIENVSVAKMQSIGESALGNCKKLKSISFPQVTNIEQWAFYGCPLLNQYNVGSTPPTLGSGVFTGTPSSRYLVFVDANGTPLTGTDLTNTRATYKAVSDGNTTDNLWNGWNINATLYNIQDISTNGSVIPSASVAQANENISLTISPNAGYSLQANSLKVYKTGDPTTVVSINTNNSFTMPAYDVTVEATFEIALAVTINGTTTKYGSSLQDALNGVSLGTITSLEITGGDFSTDDWEYLKNQSSNISTLTSFVITSDIASVADIADLGGGQRYFNNSVETIHISKVQSVGQYVFTGSNLTRVVLPNATTLRDGIVHPNLTRLSLGATPPSATSSSFYNTTNQRYLEYVDTNGTPLTGTALTNAQTAYEAVNDGDTTDNLWYGWITNADYNIAYTTTTNGAIEGIDKAAENQALTVTVTPDLGYELQGTLNVYKTGDPSTTVTVNADNTFTMPAYDVTVEATFVQLPPLQVTINGSRNKSAVLLRNVMNGEDLSTITSLEITGGKFVEDDWKYLSDNKSSFTAMTHFTIAHSITSVEDWSYRPFNKDVIQSISLAKLERLAEHCVNNSNTLTTLYLPNITHIGEHSFNHCTALNQLTIGATPPISYHGYGGMSPIFPNTMTIVDANGTPLTGTALSTAQAAYQAVNDGNTNDNLWLGWKIDALLHNILYSNYDYTTYTYKKGNISLQGGGFMAANENDNITLEITPDAGYQLQSGSLKVYKTGDETTTVTVSGTNSFTMPAFDVTVEAEFEQLPLQVTINGATNKTGTSLQNALNGVQLSTITSLEITGGLFTTADWNFIRNNTNSFTLMTDFTITNTIAKVADIPDLNYGESYFKNDKLENVSIANVQVIGDEAFRNNTALKTASFPDAISMGNVAFASCTSLTSVSFPNVTTIGNSAFRNCTSITSVSFPEATHLENGAFTHCSALTNASFPKAQVFQTYAFTDCSALTQLKLGTTPPTVMNTNAFTNNPTQRSLVIVDANGTELTGTALTNARATYRAVLDVRTDDNLWYGWKINPALYNIFHNNQRGTITVAGGIMAGAENEVINLVITPDANFQLQAGSLKAYKTGDTSTVVTISNTNSFSMPAYDVTIEAVFVPTVITLDITINDETIKTGTSLENALVGENLANITNLDINTGDFTTADWNYLKNNRTNLNALRYFTIHSTISTVADIPNTTVNEPYFNTDIVSLFIDKVKVIGTNAFNGSTSLLYAYFKDAIKIEEYAFANCTLLEKNLFTKLNNIQANAFNGCTSLTHLNLGLTPPSNVDANAFANIPNSSHLQFNYHDGTTPSNTDYTNAITAYRAVNDGNTNDNLWYGWIINNRGYQVTYNPGTNGTITGVTSQIEGRDVNFTVTPDAFYQLQAGSLKAYKTGDVSTTVTLSGNSFTMPNYPVTVEGIFETTSTAITVTINGATTKSGSSLENVLTGETLANITSLEVTAGIFLTTDWQYLDANKSNFSAMTHFTIANTITSVDNLNYRSFNENVIENISIAKLQRMEDHGFRNSPTLKAVSLPNATYIGEHAFQDCSALTQLTLGATPPSILYAFVNVPMPRNLTFVDTNGNALTGTALTNAKAAYKAVTDGNTTDNLWYGWSFDYSDYAITYNSTTNGSVSGVNTAIEGANVDITITPDSGYRLQANSLKVHKTGDTNTTVTITGNSFTMPAYDVTVDAVFETAPLPLNITVNGSINRTGSSLENALNGIALSTITQLEIYGGDFTTADWNYLQTNRNTEFTSLTHFTVTDGINSIANMPHSSSFNISITNVSIAKMDAVGFTAFYGATNLTTASFPDATQILEHSLQNCTALTSVSIPKADYIDYDAFSGNTSLIQLTVGATPPATVAGNPFKNNPTQRNLTFVDTNGNTLTGTALANAIVAYKAVNDGNTTDNLWYGWKFRNPVTWTGTTNTNWNTTTNWSNGEVPLLNDDVIINSGTNYPVLNGTTSVTLNNVTLENNTSIFIEDNASITINGNLEVKTNAKIKVTSTVPSAGTINSGSVILKGTYTEATPNSFTYFTETYHNNDDGWTLVSSPTVGQIIDGGTTGFAMYNQLQTSAKGNYGIATYDNSVANDNWNYYTITEIGQTNNIQMTSGKGYSIFPNSNASVSQNKGNIRFKGAVPATDVTITVATNSGTNTNKFNLIGNPYPAFIPANTNANATNNILTTNSGILSEQTLWFWSKETQSYITVNQATTSRFIAPTQGFFVKAIDNGNFNFTKTMQVNQSAGVYNKNTNTRPEIKLTISQDGTSKNSDIFYINGTTTGFDNGYDSSIFGGTTETLNVYTNLVDTNEAMQLAIQSLPDSDYDTMVIPVGVIAEANKEVNFSANTTNLPAGIKVYLEDRLLGTFTDITTENYKVTFSDNVNGTGRFYLHTSSNALSTDSNEVVENDIVIYLANNTINISGLATEKATIMMYDLIGKEIINTTVTSQNLIQIPIPLTTSKGVYIVNIITKNGQITKKIVLK